MEEAERLSKKRGRANGDEAEDWTMMPFLEDSRRRTGRGGSREKGKGERRGEERWDTARMCDIGD